jgi:hypothetical protein
VGYCNEQLAAAAIPNVSLIDTFAYFMVLRKNSTRL